MTARTDAMEALLARVDWSDAIRTPLAGDASRRRYVRLSLGEATRILMDAPPDPEHDIRPFVVMAQTLAARGLSVPLIHAGDEVNGYLLIEDLGDDTFTRLLSRDPGREGLLYATAAEALARLQSAPPPDELPSYPEQMPELAALSVDWYAPGADRGALVAAMGAALDHPSVAERVLVHRDFHADNLIWLPDRTGPARVGMLDFQDAMKGPRDYDLASLIHDPRRRVSDAARQAALDAWQAATGRAAQDVAAGVAICSAQRCLRILGVFARLCLRDGKAHYIDFIPATWAALMRDLSHPALADLRRAVEEALPEPDAGRLDAIRAAAGSRTGAERAVA
jgi:aminoglycoside/choline kinase family phosphotransferase